MMHAHTHAHTRAAEGGGAALALESRRKRQRQRGFSMSARDDAGDPLAHRQTDHSPATGNALQCCVATILRMSSLDAVPNFIKAADPYAVLRAFLADKGLGFVKIELDAHGRMPFYPGDCDVVVAGPSPRGDFRHAVVGRLRDASSRIPHLVFDPHESDAFFNGKPAAWVGLFVALRPWAN